MLAIALALIVVAAVAVVVVVQATEPKGPPSSPQAVVGKGSVCTPPDCKVLSGAVSLSWSAPTSGSAVTGYDIYRDNTKITDHPLAGTATTFDDHLNTFGVTMNYQVIAHSSDGDSGKSTKAEVKIPFPPSRFAQLAGLFTVHLTVQRASNLAKASGIDQPTPGDTTTETWSLEPVCPPNSGPCSLKLLSFANEVLRPRGRAYEGGGQGESATCFPNGSVHAIDAFHLVPTRPGLSGFNWVYEAFTGTFRLSFSCPNSLPSSATFTLTAKSSPGSATSTS